MVTLKSNVVSLCFHRTQNRSLLVWVPNCLGLRVPVWMCLEGESQIVGILTCQYVVKLGESVPVVLLLISFFGLINRHISCYSCARLFVTRRSCLQHELLHHLSLMPVPQLRIRKIRAVDLDPYEERRLIRRLKGFHEQPIWPVYLVTNLANKVRPYIFH